MRYNTFVLIPPQAGKEETKMANEKILVVDDDKNICELLRLYLVKEGYNVTMSTTAARRWQSSTSCTRILCCWTL